MNENKNHDPIASDLQANIDYLYCPVCKAHVPCIRTETGYWEVTCPGCFGECSLCECYLARFCFGRREEFPPLPTSESDAKE